jgi:hypothetical protein
MFMKRKRNQIGVIVKWKVRLCAGGHKSIEFVNYWSTYSPVVLWSTICILIVLALINGWPMQLIDFVLAYPQAEIKTDIYMKPPTVPPGFIIPDLPTYEKRTTSTYKLLCKTFMASKTQARHGTTTPTKVSLNAGGRSPTSMDAYTPNAESSLWFMLTTQS